MRQRTTRRGRYAVAAVVVIALGLLRLTPLWELATARAFDLLSTVDAPAPDDSQVVLVAIDEASFAEIGLQWSWPREIHAELIEALRSAGARSVALDTVLFADVRGFTSISEAMKDDPQGLTALVNEVLTPLSDVILAHGGTIDKYMGDCVMAFWNAPLDQPDHAQRAVAAGEAMVAAMPGINAAIAHRLPPGAGIAIGVGINSGTCVVGNLGSARRFDYSVLGDAVNVASRLEGLTKDYATPILLGEETARRLGEAPALRLVDHVAVRGKSAPTGICALS